MKKLTILGSLLLIGLIGTAGAGSLIISNKATNLDLYMSLNPALKIAPNGSYVYNYTTNIPKFVNFCLAAVGQKCTPATTAPTTTFPGSGFSPPFNCGGWNYVSTVKGISVSTSPAYAPAGSVSGCAGCGESAIIYAQLAMIPQLYMCLFNLTY